MTETIYRKLKDLTKLKGNPRFIKDDDFARLCVSVKSNPDYFEARPLILSDRTGELVIIAGNQRFEAAKHLKLKEVPTCLLEGLDEAREKEIIIRDNVSNGSWDFDAIANEWSDFDLASWGLDIPDFEAVEVEPIEEDEAAVGEMIDKAEELNKKWQVKTGDLWQIGRHRLLCGDSTKRSHIDYLTNEEEALLLTDPPYGIALNSEWQNDVHKKQGKALNHSTKEIENDKGEIKTEMFSKYSRRIVFGFPYLSDSDATGWFVWNKEPNFEGKSLTSPIEMAYSTTWQGFRKVDLLWSGYLREANSEEKLGHPTQKPIRLFTDIILAHEDKNILDLFGGSGSTMVACEQLNRKAFLLEISENYCAVILERLSSLGLEAKRID